MHCACAWLDASLRATAFPLHKKNNGCHKNKKDEPKLSMASEWKLEGRSYTLSFKYIIQFQDTGPGYFGYVSVVFLTKTVFPSYVQVCVCVPLYVCVWALRRRLCPGRVQCRCGGRHLLKWDGDRKTRNGQQLEQNKLSNIVIFNLFLSNTK